MTTNERVYVAGLMPEWDAAAVSRYRKRMVEILGKVGLAKEAVQIADAVLANAKRYMASERAFGRLAQISR